MSVCKLFNCVLRTELNYETDSWLELSRMFPAATGNAAISAHEGASYSVLQLTNEVVLLETTINHNCCRSTMGRGGANREGLLVSFVEDYSISIFCEDLEDAISCVQH